MFYFCKNVFLLHKIRNKLKKWLLWNYHFLLFYGNLLGDIFLRKRTKLRLKSKPTLHQNVLKLFLNFYLGIDMFLN